MTEPVYIPEGPAREALHALRVEFVEWQLREFPMAGFDALRQMADRGLCTQEEADRAIAVARGKIIEEYTARADRLPPVAGDDLSDEGSF